MPAKLRVCKKVLKKKGISNLIRSRQSSAHCPGLLHISAASARDRASFPAIANSFEKYLQGELAEVTVAQYIAAFRGLFEMHGKAPNAMASTEYVQVLRKKQLQNKYVAVAKAFCKFKGISVVCPGKNIKRKAQSAFIVKALRPFRDAGVQERESFVELEKAFSKSLQDEYPEVTAKQYLLTLRKLFIDHGKAPDEIASAKYLDMVRGLKMPFKYAAAVKAFCKFKGVVGDGVAERREHADKEALRLLTKAQEHGRRVSDADVLAILRVLPFSENTFRENVRPKGAKFVYSLTIGLIADRCGRKCLSQITNTSEGVVRLLCEWFRGQLGHDLFPFTSININKNYAAAIHRDRNNHGPSAIRSVGNFHNGQLCYWPNTPKSVDVASLKEVDSVVMDPQHSVAFFDGNFPHGVKPYAGDERYSMVFFTMGGYQGADAKTIAQLKRLGMQWPSDKSMASARSLISGCL